MSIQRVLIVDDDSLSREFLTEAVRSLGFHAESVSSVIRLWKGYGDMASIS